MANQTYSTTSIAAITETKFNAGDKLMVEYSFWLTAGATSGRFFKGETDTSADYLKTTNIGDMTQEMKLEPEAETIGTRKIDIMTVKQTMDPTKPGAEMHATMMGIMLGSNGIQSRFTTLAATLLAAAFMRVGSRSMD